MKTIEKKKEKEINLKDLFFVIKTRFWVVIVVTIIFTLIGVFYSNANKTLLYQSSSRIIIDAEPEYRNTLQVIIKDPVILDIVVKKVGLQITGEQLSGKITVDSVDNSQVVSIGVTDTDPNRAAVIANTVAQVFKEQIPNIVNFNKVSLLSEAKENPWPINQNQNKLVIIAFILGLIAGTGLLFLLDSLDDSLRNSRDIEQLLELPLLGVVSKMSKRNVRKKTSKLVGIEIRGEKIGSK